MRIQLIIDYDADAGTLSVEHGDKSDAHITPQSAVDLMLTAIEALQDPENILHETLQ